MTQIHDHEKQQFKKLFKQEGIDHIEDRFKVLEAFLQTERHVTADELNQLLDKIGYPLDPDFVKDTLNLMCRFGFAWKNRFDNGKVCYEHRHIGRHHDHLICTKCGKIIDFKDQKLENQMLRIATAHGFHMLQHRMEIYGICSDCLKESTKLIPLVTAKEGERLIIRELTGGAKCRMRLMTMGLRIKDEIEVVAKHGNGQMVVASGYHRYILGPKLARKIMVRST